MKIGILGYRGRVGQRLVQELQSGDWPDLLLEGGTVPHGEDIPAEQNFYVTDNAESLFTRAAVLIDFTAPEATAQHAWLAAKHKKPLVIGTTGLSAAQESELSDAAKEAPILYAANMSVGVNMLLALVEQAAARLGNEWDIEIAETHHKHKPDAPSGTALALGKAAATGRSIAFAAPLTDRNGAREKGSIGYAVQRGGDVVGEHTVTFFSEGERVELGHIATDRGIFAKGALRAASWLARQPAGLYSLRDMLNL